MPPFLTSAVGEVKFPKSNGTDPWEMRSSPASSVVFFLRGRGCQARKRGKEEKAREEREKEDIPSATRRASTSAAT